MDRVHVYWTKRSTQLTAFLNEIKDEPYVQFIPADQQSGEGEELLTSDVPSLTYLAKQFGCATSVEDNDD